MVRDALVRHRSVARAAGELGVTRQGLSKLMARLQVDRFDRDDPHAPPPAPLALGDAVELGEDALHLLRAGLAAAVEAHAAMAAVEQRHVGVLLQRPDAVGDGGRGDAKFLAGGDVALVAGRGLEEAQAFERGQKQQRYSTSGRDAYDNTRLLRRTIVS